MPNCFLFIFIISCTEEKNQTTEIIEPSYKGDVPYFSAATLIPEPKHVNAIWSGVGLLDYDGDGWLDIFLPNGENAPDALYRNMGNGDFVDVAEEAGLASLKANGGVAIGDFDNDGDPDMVVNTVCSTGTWSDDEHIVDPAGGLLDGGKILYENLGDGHFQEREFALSEVDFVLLERCTVSITPVDANNDGFLDLVLSNGHDQDVAPPWIFDKNAQYSQNVLLYNDGRGNFNRTLIFGGRRTTFATAVLDVNNDGNIDLVQAQGGGPLDVLFGNGNGDFELVDSAFQGGRGLWMGVTVADFNRDGKLDLFTTNQGLSPYVVGYDNTYHLFFEETEPNPGEFREVIPFQSIHLGENGGFTTAAEVTIEGADFLAGDLFEEALSSLFFQGYDVWLPIENLERYGWSWGAVSLDANADGWMDIAFTGNNGTAPLNIISTEERGAGMGALLVSTGAMQFYDLTEESGVANIDETGLYPDGRGVVSGDLNNDGYPDLVFANRSYNPSLSDP